jgi:hypothetical protein
MMMPPYIAGQFAVVSLALLPQHIRSVDVFNVARHRFAGKLAPHVLDKAKLPTAIAFRPPILSHHLSSKCLINPLAMGFLKLRRQSQRRI